jgi:TIR domain
MGITARRDTHNQLKDGAFRANSARGARHRKPGGVFISISYRRKDSFGIAGRISDRLKKRLGDRNIFFDVEDMKAGYRWREQLAERVGSCNALVAVIGKAWNPITGNDNRVSTIRMILSGLRSRRRLSVGLGSFRSWLTPRPYPVVKTFQIA